MQEELCCQEGPEENTEMGKMETSVFVEMSVGVKPPVKARPDFLTSRGATVSNLDPSIYLLLRQRLAILYLTKQGLNPRLLTH